MNDKIQDMIDRYIHVEMTAEERKVFEKLLETNSELREKFEFTKTLKDVMTSRERKKKLFTQWEEEIQQTQHSACAATSATGPDSDDNPQNTFTNSKGKSTKTQTKHNKKLWITSMTGVAAAFAIAFLLFRQASMPTSDDVALASGISSSESVNAHDYNYLQAFNGHDETIEEILELLEKEDFEEALTKIEEAENSYNDAEDHINKTAVNTTQDSIIPAKNSTRNLGNSDDKDKNDSERLIDKSSDKKAHIEKLKWLKSIALIRLDRKTEATRLLKEIRQSGGKYSTKADSILDRWN